MEIRRAVAADIDEATAVLASALESGTAEAVQAAIEEGACMLALVDGRLVGVGTARICDASEALPLGQEYRLTALGIEGRVGLMKSCVVLEGARRHGVGSALTAARAAWLDEQGVTDSICCAWIYPDGSVPARHQLVAAGFSVLAQVPGCWREDSIVKDYPCRRCGRPCECDAEILIRRI